MTLHGITRTASANEGCVSQRIINGRPLATDRRSVEKVLRLLLVPLLVAGIAAIVPLAATGGTALSDIGQRIPSPAAAPVCADGDIPCRMQLAADALRQERPNEAEAIFRSILKIDPGAREAYQQLVELADKRPLSKDSDTLRATHKLLDGSFREYETRRFIVLSNADAQWSRAQSEYLERAHHQFLRFANRVGLQPLPLQHKLVCVLFERQREYRAFASTHDDVSDAWIVGHYSPRNDRVVFFRQRDDGHEVSAQESIATTIHEAIHQLHFHTRVKTLSVQYPLWICEGLATAFETDTPNQAFGPDHEYAPRRSRFEQLLRQDQLLPLQELVAITQLTDADDTNISAVYHQSYAFVTWASRFRAAQLRAYLDAMLRQPPGRVNAERHVAIFSRAFGDIDAVERQWLMHERRTLAQQPSELHHARLHDDLPLRVCACHAPATDADNRLSYRLLAHALSLRD